MADTNFIPNITDGSVNPQPVQYEVVTDDGAISVYSGIVFLNKAGVIAATIASPPTAMNGAKLLIISLTAQAHTVTYATVGFNETGTSGDVATFGGAIGDNMSIVAYGGKWYVDTLRNVTLA